MNNKFLGWAVKRLKERNTWLGVVSALTALGVYVGPELKEAIITAGIGLAGIILALFPDVATPDVPKDSNQEGGGDNK